MKGEHLGEFEELVMLTIVYLGSDAYGVKIRAEINERMGRKVSLSAVHVTTYRLEDKGLIESSMSGASSVRGGRNKRVYKLTNTGVRILKTVQEQKQPLWDLIPKLKYT